MFTWEHDAHLITDQIVAVSPLKVFLHCAVIQSDPGIIMTQAYKIKNSTCSLDLITFVNIYTDKYLKSMFDFLNLCLLHHI